MKLLIFTRHSSNAIPSRDNTKKELTKVNIRFLEKLGYRVRNNASKRII